MTFADLIALERRIIAARDLWRQTEKKYFIRHPMRKILSEEVPEIDWSSMTDAQFKNRIRQAERMIKKYEEGVCHERAILL